MEKVVSLKLYTPSGAGGLKTIAGFMVFVRVYLTTLVLMMVIVAEFSAMHNTPNKT